MEGGYPRKLLNLISNERNWLVKKEDDHGDGDEKKLELRLGPPGVDEDWSAKNKPKPANTSQKRCAPAPVVGWPPIRSFRKNIASSSSSKQSPPSDSQNGVVSNNVVKSQKMAESSQKGLFVKINMIGIPIGRKVDLSAYDSYEKLSDAVDQLFRGLLAAQNDTSGTGINGNLENEKAITGLLDGSGEYTLVYEDNEGDRMLVGDVPWHMFVSAVKRLRVIKSSEISSICMGSKQEKVQRC